MGQVAVVLFLIVVLGVALWRVSTAATRMGGVAGARAARMIDVLGLSEWPPWRVAAGDTVDADGSWVDAQLVIVSRQDATLVLDCVVYPIDRDGPDSSPPTLLTLRAHPRADLTPLSVVGSAMSHWVAAGTPVGLAVRVEGDTPVLRIADEALGIALHLEDSL